MQLLFHLLGNFEKADTLTAVWTRFFPLSQKLQNLIHIEKAIGRVTRAFIDFGLEMPLDKQPPGSRVADLALGAGTLLDIGMYNLTWENVIMNAPNSSQKAEIEEPKIVSSLVLNKGVDEMSTVVLSYPQQRVQVVCTASYNYKSESEFCRIEGTEGTIHLLGRATSKPHTLILRKKNVEKEEKMEYLFEGWGFFYEADAVAKDIRDGKVENNVMPFEESIRMMEVLDDVRRAGGLRYPQDDE